jgi:hypothetical protein
MAGFRNTTTYGISTKLSGRTYKYAKVLCGTSQATFTHGNEDIKSEPHNAVPHETLGRNLISTNQ